MGKGGVSMTVNFKTDTVEYLFKAGEDFVKSTMPKENAEKIVALKAKMSKKQRFRNLMDKVKLVLKIGN